MTIKDFVSSNGHCAINNVPRDEVARIVTEILSDVRPNNALRAIQIGGAQDLIHLRFKGGVYANWLNGGPAYHRGRFGVEVAVEFADLDEECDDEIDVSCDVLADIL